MQRISTIFLLITLLILGSCSKPKESAPPPPPPPPPPVENFSFSYAIVDGKSGIVISDRVSVRPMARLLFTAAVDSASAVSYVTLTDTTGTIIPVNTTLEKDDSIVVIQPKATLTPLSKYIIHIKAALVTSKGTKLNKNTDIALSTSIDSSDKFARISDDELLTRVQSQTFKYIWDFAHPVSGMIREGSKHGADIVTSGGTGFGIMGLITGIERGFITRTEGLGRMTTMTKFLDEKVTKHHGAFSHWINGTSGATIQFGQKDNGGDLVETSFLMQGLLTARQYFNNNNPEETELRDRINKLWNGVEWDWYRQNDQNVLYWHWSPEFQWEKNLKIQGWNECLITYVLAASSTSHTIPKDVYTQGWAKNGNFRNGNTYYDVKLPLGSNMGGPLFFTHYSFMGLDPRGLKDEYDINYWEQNVAHAQINNKYCIDNPKQYYGYSPDCWGLTASTSFKITTGKVEDDYAAHAPTNDRGVIAPTAALASFPYTPAESKKALEFFYYKLGDKVWGNYGFIDAFSLQQGWYSPAFLAIDQAPIIVMIENHRTGKLWDLFMSCPEVKAGLTKLGFKSPKI